MAGVGDCLKLPVLSRPDALNGHPSLGEQALLNWDLGDLERHKRKVCSGRIIELTKTKPANGTA